MVSSAPKLTFYTTVGCHLCEQAEMLLTVLAAERTYQLETVDIASDEALVNLYGIRIPVVKNPVTKQEIGWPFGLPELADLI